MKFLRWSLRSVALGLTLAITACGRHNRQQEDGLHLYEAWPDQQSAQYRECVDHRSRRLPEGTLDPGVILRRIENPPFAVRRICFQVERGRRPNPNRLAGLYANYIGTLSEAELRSKYLTPWSKQYGYGPPPNSGNLPEQPADEARDFCRAWNNEPRRLPGKALRLRRE